MFLVDPFTCRAGNQKENSWLPTIAVPGKIGSETRSALVSGPSRPRPVVLSGFKPIRKKGSTNPCPLFFVCAAFGGVPHQFIGRVLLRSGAYIRPTDVEAILCVCVCC